MARERYEWFYSGITALQGELFAYAFSITRSREDAEDAVHNAVIKAFEGLPKLKNRAKLKPWLFAILRNECLLQLRLGKRFSELTEDIPAAESDAETKIDLKNAVGSLSTELREVVVLYYKLGYSTGEIARLINIPRGTVMSRLARARDLIKTHIEGEQQ